MQTPARRPPKSPSQAQGELYAARTAQEVFERHITWVDHKEAGVTVNVEVGQAVVGGQVRWYGYLVLGKGERLSLPGGAVPAGARLTHQAIEGEVRRQVQRVTTKRVLQGLLRPQQPTGGLFD